MQHRTLLFITIVSVTFASFVGGLHAQSYWFSDVPDNHWAKDAIDFVVNKRVMKGMDANTFAPDEPMTRAQLATVIYRLFGEDDLGQIGDARDAQRRSDANTILNAIYQYAIDNDGRLPTDIRQGKTLEICKFDVECPSTMVELTGFEDIYLLSVPIDPEEPETSKSTGYTVSEDLNGRITISAPHAETTDTSVTR